MARGSFCVLDNDDLKFLLNQFPQVSFNTNIYQNSEQKTLLMLRLRSCFHEVVTLRYIDLMKTDHDRLTILKEGLV